MFYLHVQSERLPLQGVIDHPWMVHHCGPSEFYHRSHAAQDEEDPIERAELDRAIEERLQAIKSASDREM